MNGLKTIANFLCDSCLPLFSVKFLGQTHVNPSVLALVHCTVINAVKGTVFLEPLCAVVRI